MSAKSSPPPPIPEPATRSLSWGARELGVGLGYARKLAGRGLFPGAFRVGRTWRVAVAVFRREVTTLGESHTIIRELDERPIAEQLRLITADAPSVDIRGETIPSEIDNAKALSIGPVDTVDSRVRVAQSRSNALKRAQSRNSRPQPNGGKQ